MHEIRSDEYFIMNLKDINSNMKLKETYFRILIIH